MMISSIRTSLSRGGQRILSNPSSPASWRKALFTSRPLSTSSSASDSDDRLIVVGSGVAGSATALIAAEVYKIPVTMLFAGAAPTDCNSYWAQGGIIYRNYDEKSGDSADLLAEDIHRAGAGLCHDPAVRKVSEEGPERVRQLLLDGKYASVPFDRDAITNEFALCLEASHGAPRILHKADHTGAVITQHITQAAAQHPLIQFKANTVVTDLLTDDNNERCVGVETLDQETGELHQMYATKGTVLASGGLGGIYQHSTNPAGFNALGSSVALAARADVHNQDLEFVQFHPTALFIPNEARFLLTEALRGEGAKLRDASGRAFCLDYHPNAELAPRDIVARAVFAESQKATGDDGHNVFLDITHREAKWLHNRFPTIQKHLSERGLDIAKDQLPIIPAAHYTCGGIATDLHGRTNLAGLYAAGEAARTGLHGGNRLASTSLLEGLVFGASVADYVGSEAGAQLADQTKHSLQNAIVKPRKQRNMQDAPKNENASHRAMQLLTTVRRVMWDYVGVVRTPSGLATAADMLEELKEQANLLHHSSPTMETAAVRDAATAGLAVTHAAEANPRSVGAHCIVPDEDASVSDSDEEDQVAGSAMN